MKALVTGGAGFIGSHIVDKLIDMGHHVAIVDNLTSGKKENINSKATFYENDICDESLGDIFEKEKPNIVFHLAAQMDVRFSVKHPKFDAEQNILGSINLIENCRKHLVDKILFASTGGAIYGEQDTFPADESHLQNPVSPYGIAKLSVEKYLYYYYHEYGLKYVSLRYANVYGPRQNSKGEAGVVAIFVSKMLSGEQPIIFGDGKQTRDFVYVDDVVQFNILSAEKDVVGIFNVGTSVETDINQIFHLVRSSSHSNCEEVHGEGQPGEQRRSVITFDKAFQVLGYKPSTILQDGIEKTVSWFRDKIKG